MTRLSEQFRRKSQGLTEYIAACDAFINALENLEGAIEEYGSDPLGVLSRLTITDTPTERVLQEPQRLTKDLIESALPKPPEPAPEPLFRITETRIKEAREAVKPTPQTEGEKAFAALDDDELSPADRQKEERFATTDDTSGVVTEEPATEAESKLPTKERRGEQAYMNKTKPRHKLSKKAQEVQTWLYSVLMDGPVARAELEALAQKKGYTMYIVNEARKHTNDIMVQVIGMRGPHFWYIKGQEDKLPKPVDMRKINQSVKNGVNLRPEEVKVLNALPGTLAEVIGRTGMKPIDLKEKLERLRMLKKAQLDKRTSTWQKVTPAVA